MNSHRQPKDRQLAVGREAPDEIQQTDPAAGFGLLIAAIALSVAVRAVYWLDYRGSPLFDVAAGPDVTEYHEWASDILSGNLLWREIPLHGPAYAYVLALWYSLTNTSIPAVRAIQLTWGILGLLAVTLAVRKRFGTCAAAATAILWAVYVPLVYYEAELFCEGLSCFLHCLILALLISAPVPVTRWRCAIVGILLGLSIITHPTAVILTGLIVAWLALDAWHVPAARRWLWVNPSLTLILAGLVVLPVSVHNSRLEGRFVLVQRHDGLNFYIGNRANADGTPNVRFGYGWDMLLRMPRDQAGLNREADRREFYFQKSYEFMRGSTGQWLMLLGRKLALAVNSREVTASTPISALRSDIALLRLPQVGFGMLLALAAIGLYGGIARVAPACILILAFLATQTIFVAAGRYRAPMLPGMFVLAGLGWQQLWSLYGNRDRRGMTWAIAFAAAAVLVAWLPVVPAGNDYPAEGLLARATAYQRKNNWPAAVAELKAAVAVEPEHVPSQINLGQALDKLGRTEDALTHLRQAVEIQPDYPWALAALGYALDEHGDPGSAVTCYERALRNDPEYSYARIELARLFVKLGRWREAADHYRFFVSRHPGDIEARLGLVDVLCHLNRDDEAARILQSGLQQSPENVACHLRLAQLRASSANAQVVNPPQALALARRAAKLVDISSVLRRLQNADRSLDPAAARVLDVLAMAYAANGSFDLAIKTADLAVRAAELTGQPELKRQISSRREQYLKQQPFREQAANTPWDTLPACQ